MGNKRVISSLESFDPHAEPEFLTDGKRIEIVLGDTVVLPCKLNNLGKICQHKNTMNLPRKPLKLTLLQSNFVNRILYDE